MSDGKTALPQPQQPKRKDELLYCDHCGISFLWSVEEQKVNRPLATPKYCQSCLQLQPNAQRERGLVKWFNSRKHFGFIVRRNAEEIFAPAAEVQSRSRLQEGDLVEFTVGSNERGLFAQKIRILTMPIAEGNAK